MRSSGQDQDDIKALKDITDEDWYRPAFHNDANKKPVNSDDYVLLWEMIDWTVNYKTTKFEQIYQTDGKSLTMNWSPGIPVKNILLMPEQKKEEYPGFRKPNSCQLFETDYVFSRSYPTHLHLDFLAGFDSIFFVWFTALRYINNFTIWSKKYMFKTNISTS